ncbi:MAG TPA: 50S ribosomal protein L13 [Thermoprotei archaeon]|nr:50S ribosomal protein L13 [Thermoprotei archaeon]
MTKEIVIDATGHVLGRLASLVAKKLLEGERIVIVNAEKSVIIGSKKMIIDRYKKKLEWRTYYNPEKRGPKIPRRPDTILKRTIRGMLPHKKSRGRNALKRLKVFIGIPERYSKSPFITLNIAKKDLEKYEFITLGELSKAIGGM